MGIGYVWDVKGERLKAKANPPMQNHSTAVLESLNFTPRSHLNLSSSQVGAHEQKTNDLDSNGSPGETLRSQQARIQISVGARDSFWKVVTYSIIIHVRLIQHSLLHPFPTFSITKTDGVQGRRAASYTAHPTISTQSL